MLGSTRLAPLASRACLPLVAAAALAPAAAARQLTTNGQPVPPVRVSPPTLGAASSPLVFSEDSTGNLYTLDPTNGASTLIGTSGTNSSTVGLSPRDATTLFGSQPFSILITQADGSGTAVLGPQVAEGLAYDPSTDTLYGAINGSFFTIDTTTGTLALPLAAAPGDVEGIAFGNDGVYGLVGFAGSDPNLYFYDPGSDTWSMIGSTGIDWNLVGLAYDPATNNLYAKGSQDTNLYRIDPATGATAFVGSTGLASGGGLAWHSTGPPCTVVFCDANPANASDIAVDTCSCAAGSINLLLSNAPPAQFGYAMVGSGNGTVTNPPGAFGDLCLSGATIGRYSADAIVTDAGGNASVDLLNAVSGGGGGNIPTIGGNLCAPPNQTWNFQWWHRDGMNPSKFSKALQVTFQ